MILQHLLLATEISYFANMIHAVQNKSPTFVLQALGSYLLLYGIIVFLLDHYVIEKDGSLREAFLLGAALFIISDFTMYTLFEKSRPYLPLFIYDVLLVGGGCAAATTYLVKNYYKSIEQYNILLFITYVASAYFTVLYK